MATATKPRTAKPKAELFEGNTVVARRLAFITEAKLAQAHKKFQEGTSAAKLTEEYGFKREMHAVYALRQYAVMQGLVSTIEPNAEAIKKAIDSDDPNTDWHWLACRTGLSTGKVRNLVES
jgi:hypothetical protein